MTEPWLSFNPVIDPLWLTIILIASGCFFLFLEWKKPAKYRTLRPVLLLIGCISIAGLLFRPQIRLEKSDSAILLTDNFDRRKADSVINLHPTATLYSLPEINSFNGSKSIESIHELEDIIHNVDFVVGDGLSNSAMDILSGAHFQHIPSGYPEGVIDLRIKNPVIVNRANSIHGSANFLKENQKIILEGPGGKEDSIVLTRKGIQNFFLSFTPKQVGNFLYSFNTPGKSEKLPIQVVEQSSSNILFLQQYPTFETRYLKQMLGKKHNLLFRYELSKNIFRFEKINDPGNEFQRLSESVLTEFDLLILDTDAFQQLGSNEVKAIKNSVRNGLGVIFLFNDQPGKSVRSFLPFNVGPHRSDTAHFQLSSKKIVLPTWPLEIKSGVTPSVKNKSRILSGYTNDGFGKIGFQLLQETYRLSLEGDSLSYINIWNDLLEKVVRTKQEAFKINVNNTFPIYADEPITIEIIANEDFPKLIVDSVAIPLAEDPIIDGLWKTKIWFDKPGWQNIQVEGYASETPVYVSPDTEWNSLSSANTIRRTQRVSATDKKTNKVQLSYSPVNPVVFYLMFLFCFSTLWLLPKV
jgi:hypothetical protein